MFILLAGCGGGGTPRNVGGGDGSTPLTPDLAASPVGSTLAGTWELTATGTTKKGTLLLDSSSINVSIGSYVFLMHVKDAQADLTWQSPLDGQLSIDVIRTPAALDTGAFPLPIGGDWSFSEKGVTGKCLGSIRAGVGTGGCQHVGRVPSPLPSLNRQVQATRTKSATSLFGDLGGTWSIRDDDTGSCDLTIAGSTLTANCHSGGSIVLQFSDGLASGTIGSGGEFSARRL